MATIKALMNLKGRRALVTGALGFLGVEIAKTLAELGADLVLVDRKVGDLEKLSEQLSTDWNVESEYYYCDLESEIQRIQLVSKVRSKIKPLNILVNNAAFVGTDEIPGWAVPFEEQSIDTWRRALEVNLTAVFHLSQSLMPLLRKSEGASIINIGSIYGVCGPDWALYEGSRMGNPAAYGVSKGGIIQLSRWLATTVAPDVRVNVISPGGIARGQSSKFMGRYEEKVPLGRMATEEDFRGVLMLLATDLSRYITGQNILVDGGWSAW